MATPTRPLLARYATLIAAVAIVACAIVWLESPGGIHPAAILAALRRFPAWAIAAAVGLGLLQNLCQATRLWTLLPGDKRLPWWAVFRSFTWGQLVNNYVPGRAGDVVKIALIRDVSSGDTASAARLAGGVLVADKIADVGALLLLVGVAAPALLREVHVHVPGFVFAVAAVALVVIAVVLTRRSLHKARAVLAEVLRGTSALVRLPRIGLALMFGMAAWASESVIVMVLAGALGFHLALSQALGAIAILNLGIAVPVSFANIGTFEVALVFGLTRFHTPAAAAFAIATVHHMVQVACVLLLAAGFGARRGDRGSQAAFRVRDVDKRRALDHYEGLSARYDTSVARGPLKLLRERERSAILGFARFDDPTKKTVIDVGCGGGFYVRAAKSAGLRVSAVDLAPGMVEKLAGTADEAWVSDIESLDTANKYDIVICSGVLDFVLDPETAFKNLAALTTPGGRLVVQAPRVGVAGFIYRLEKRALEIEVNLFSLAWFETEARKQGLRIAGYSHPLPTNRVVLFERPPG